MQMIDAQVTDAPNSILDLFKDLRSGHAWHEHT